MSVRCRLLKLISLKRCQEFEWYHPIWFIQPTLIGRKLTSLKLFCFDTTADDWFRLGEDIQILGFIKVKWSLGIVIVAISSNMNIGLRSYNTIPFHRKTTLKVFSILMQVQAHLYKFEQVHDYSPLLWAMRISLLWVTIKTSNRVVIKSYKLPNRH